MLFWSVLFFVAQCWAASYDNSGQSVSYPSSAYLNFLLSGGGLQYYLQQNGAGTDTGSLGGCDVDTFALINDYLQRLVPSMCPVLVPSCPTIKEYSTSSESCQVRFRASLIALMCCTSKTCGFSTIHPARSFQVRALATPKIVGGSTAQKCEFPWMAYILIGNRACGGTVIDKTHIMTAAHCLVGMDASDITVVLGEHDRTVHVGDEQVFTASEAIIHENYDNDALENDIGLITLRSSITFGPCVQPICLPSQGQSWAKKTECIAAGWGKLHEIDVPTSTTLQKATLPYYSSVDCIEEFIYSADDLNPTTICAGYHEGSKDFCKGDSGGPLMCPSDGTWVVAGVVSKSVGCARQNLPGIYTNVASFVDWIERAI